MKRTLLLVMLLSVVAGACSGPGRQLDAARQRWEDSGITTYTYQIQKFCFCPPLDAVVSVVDGRVVSVVPLNEGSVPLDGLTIEELFADLEEELGSRERGEYTIEYHPEFGYPISVNADPIKQAIDDEYSYEITLVEG